jgi:hypothetical protein
MTTKPTPKAPGPQPEDPPGWRLAFAVWDSIRHDGWSPFLKLTLLVVVTIAGLAALTATLGPWSLVAGLGGIGGTAAARVLHHRQK